MSDVLAPLQGRATLVTGAASGIGLETARQLADAGACVHAVDLRHELFATSCSKSGCGELAALIGNNTFDDLDAPIERVAAANTPILLAPGLERTVIPGEERIAEAVCTATAGVLA